jgi:hypothetical protein
MEIVRMFWTGGWDSTYRLLYLVLVKKQPVQTYYIIDPGRASFPTEIRTMDHIRRLVAERWPEAGERILPTVFKAREDIAPNPQITGRYNRMQAAFRRKYDANFGSQYDWQARFAEEAGLYDIELMEHRIEGAHPSRIRPFMEPYIQAVGDSYRLVGDDLGDMDILKYFLFPLYDLTKVDMQRQAQAYGFADIMEKTWFCFKPKRGRPCGCCNPCTYAMQQGMAWRIPFLRRFRNYALKEPVRILKKNKAVQAIARMRRRRTPLAAGTDRQPGQPYRR